MAMDHNAPPMRIDKSFIHVRANRLKLLQIALGTLTLLFTITCFPNEVFLFCTSRFHQFTQLFNAVCVNGFFLVLTSLLAAAYLCSVPDAYYQYNFILLEKFYTTLAVLMYAIGVFIVVGQIARVPFVFSWMLDLTLTSATFTAYLLDCVPRWRNGAEPVRTLA